MSANGLVSLMDATMIAHMGYNRVLRLVQVGEVRGQRIGKSWFVDAKDLNRWLARQEATSKSKSASR